uniref:Uncharacterized protein n=1 Tax=Oryza sativa subsp. japonica TaxID=39947 RepID=Q8H4C8_ORYSJ|nr:hypothetical protein [Oryza sativa Japonica Group]BAD31304.1 hypothetical protein [Oryza sativa Japonica Group]
MARKELLAWQALARRMLETMGSGEGIGGCNTTEARVWQSPRGLPIAARRCLAELTAAPKFPLPVPV